MISFLEPKWLRCGLVVGRGVGHGVGGMGVVIGAGLVVRHGVQGHHTILPDCFIVLLQS